MMKKRKRYDRLAAFMLAMVVAATSCMPAVSQPVYAAPEDESTDAGSPFGVNVAKGKEVTVTYLDGQYQGTTDTGEALNKIVDGDKANNWETKKKGEQKNEPEDYNVDFMIDLKSVNVIDRKSVV